VIYLYNSHTGR